MLTGPAREQLKNILEFSSWKDLKIIELKIVRDDVPSSSTAEEMIEAILSNASCPSQILKQQRLRKSILRDYLWQIDIPVTLEQSKSDYIKILLELWQVKDDIYLWKFQTDAEIAAELDRFEVNMRGSIQELKLRFKEKRPSGKELRNMKRSMDEFLKMFDSIGNIESTPPSTSSEVPIFPNLAFSDGDYDSSSSASSVEIVEESSAAVSTSFKAGPSNIKCEIPIKKEPSSLSKEPLAGVWPRRFSPKLSLPMDTSESGTPEPRTSNYTPTPSERATEVTPGFAGFSPSRNSLLRDIESILAVSNIVEIRQSISTLLEKYFR